MNAIEALEAAIARIEKLRDGATGPLPWHDEAHKGSTYTTRVIGADGYPVPGCFNCGDNEGIYEGDSAALIVALSRTVDPLIDIIGTESRRIIQNGGLREDQHHFNAVALARAVLGERDGE